MTKPQVFRTLTTGELKEKVLSFRKELFDLRNKAPGSTVEKPGRIRGVRKNIARCLTILEEKEKEVRK